METGAQPGPRDAGPAAGPKARASHYYVRPQDFWMLIVGGKTDARIAALEAAQGKHAAFEALYDASEDPWDTLNPRFSYQSRKYNRLMAQLPQRRFRRALDLGSGLGTLSRLLASRADQVVGIDVAQTAVERARHRHGAAGSLQFQRGDITDLPGALEGCFDLITIMDTLYYLPDTSDAALDDVVARIAALLEPGGLVVLSNHLFAGGWDKATRLSRRIDRAFCRSPRLALVSRHWQPFFQTTVLAALPPGTQSA